MTNKQLRVAVVGCGKMGQHHIKAIGTLGNAEIVAVVDPVIGEGQLTIEVPTTAQRFSDTASMFKSVNPDVVHIVTPPETHAKLAMMCLENGAHVYVEKPFALNSTDAKTVLDYAGSRKLKVCAAHQVLFQEPGLRYREYIGIIGDLVQIESYFSFKTVRRSPDGRSVLGSVDQLLDILPHPVYLMLSALSHVPDDDGHNAIEIKALNVDHRGEVRAIFEKNSVSALLIVTLRGRPIESYLKITGVNGSINADFILTGVSKYLGPGTSAIAVVLRPFSQARQIVFGTLATLFKIVFKKHKSYAGLAELLGAFYESILENRNSPVSNEDILRTVEICEVIGGQLKAAERVAENNAREKLSTIESSMQPADASRGIVLVTGGAGFLGRSLVKVLREAGWPVRVVGRRLPAGSEACPGIEYMQADISESIPSNALDRVSTVVHLAAETAGGRDAHERNTIKATRNLLNACVEAGIKRFINISSIAVLKTSREIGGAVSEMTPLDKGTLTRGPYVWGKAEAEDIVREYGESGRVQVRNVRPGPLVDFRAFEPPGRLGREVGPWFVVMGGKKTRINLCDVEVAAKVLLYYVEHFDDAPASLNLIQPDAPTRSELVERLRIARPDLKFVWIPNWLINVGSTALKGLLKLARPGAQPIDVQGAFASEVYDTSLASTVFREAGIGLEEGVVS